MNKIGYILITILTLTFLNQIASDFYFRDAILLEMKKNISAKKKYESCLKIDPKHIRAMLNLANLYARTIGTERRKGLKRAFDLYKKIEEIDYNYHTLHYCIALVHCEWAQWDRAIEEFNIALEQRWSNPEIYYYLGMVYYFGKKDYAKADSYLKQAFKLGAGKKHKDIKNLLKNIKMYKGK